MAISLGHGNVIGPVNQGTVIPLSQLFSLSLDPGYHATQLIFRDRTIGGGHLVNLADPTHIYPEYTSIQTISYSDLGNWEFVAASTPYTDLIGFQVVESNGSNTVTSDSAGAVVFTTNSIKGIDSPLDWTGLGNSITAAGYSFIVRYYWDTPHSSSTYANYLTKTERLSLENDHLQIVAVWEDGNNDLTGSRGTSDAQRAIFRASQAEQEDGSAIYFAVEPGQSVSAAVNYFSQVKAVFDGSGNTHHYKIGVYGTGDILNSVASYVSYKWLTGASYDTSGTASYANWDLDQIAVSDMQNADGTFHSTLDPTSRISIPNGYQGVDIDIARGDFGAFGGATNNAPVVTAQNVSVGAGQPIAASAFIYSVSDPDGDGITQFSFWDSGTGGGHFTLNDVAQPAGQFIYVPTGSLGTLKYVGGSVAGSETIYVAANDGHSWSASATAIATTTGTPNNQPPTVTPVVPGRTLTVGDDFLWSSLFNVNDPENDSFVYFSVNDSNPSGVGSWYLGGAPLSNGPNFISPPDFANLHYRATGAGTETVTFQANDGHQWSGLGSVVITVNSPSSPGSVSINDRSLAEGDFGTKLMTFTVTRTGGTAAFDVNYATSDGGATIANADYTVNSGTLHFDIGVNTQPISITINGDAAFEPNETFNVNLSGATNGATISDNLGIGTITNDDTAPRNDPPQVSLVNGANVAATSLGQVFQLSSLFSASDPNQDPLTYRLYDTPGSGHWEIAGVAQPENQWFPITQAQLAQTTFRTGSTSDDIYFVASDPAGLYDYKTVHLTAPVNGPHTVVLQPGSEGQDLWITNFYSYNDNYGVDNDVLRVGGWDDYYYSLLRFDLSAAGLPAQVSSATLRLYNNSGQGETPTGMYVDKLNTSWTEAYGWYDYALAATNIGTTSAPPATGWLDIDVTSLANAWLQNPASNDGILLRPFNNNNNFNEFVSSDATGAMAQFHPELVVQWNS